MPLYKCELCNFETKIKPHFNRHIGTAKHKKKYLNSQSHENESFKKKQMTLMNLEEIEYVSDVVIQKKEKKKGNI